MKPEATWALSVKLLSKYYFTNENRTNQGIGVLLKLLSSLVKHHKNMHSNLSLARVWMMLLAGGPQKS